MVQTANGQQWEQVLDDTHVWGLAALGDTVVVGTYDGHLLISPDQGGTWSERTGNMPNGYIENVSVADASELICTNGDGVWISQDWNTWSLSRTLGGSATCLVVSGDVILAGAEIAGGLHASFDHGVQWSMISAGQQNQYTTSVSYANDIIHWSRFNGEVLRTVDHGVSWTNVPELGNSIFSLSDGGAYAGNNTSVLSNNDDTWEEQLVETQVLDIEVSHELVAVCGAGSIDHPAIHVSIDQGANWTGIPADFAELVQVNKVVYANGYLYAGNTEGLFRLDFRSWVGLKEMGTSSLVKISPNPTQDRSVVTLTDGAPTITHLSLVDGTGRVVMQRSVARNVILELDLGAVEPGTYQLLLKHRDGVIRKAVVVAR